MIKRICQLGDPVLRAVSSAVPTTELETKETLQLIADLRDTLRHFQHEHNTGRGIAAPQIGITKRVIYIETKDYNYTLINPRYLYKSTEMFEVWDSCFSYWGFEFKVRRHQEVHIEYLSPVGESMILEASGGLAELLQHEIEHLDGHAAIDQLIPPGDIRSWSGT